MYEYRIFFPRLGGDFRREIEPGLPREPQPRRRPSGVRSGRIHRRGQP